MRSWLATIRYCMYVSTNTTATSQYSIGCWYYTPVTSPTSGAVTTNNTTITDSTATMSPTVPPAEASAGVSSPVPEIPPRRQGEQRLSASSNFELTEGDPEQSEFNVTDLTMEMRRFPWFHGTLTRSDGNTQEADDDLCDSSILEPQVNIIEGISSFPNDNGTKLNG